MFGNFKSKSKNGESEIEEIYRKYKSRFFYIAMGYLHNDADAEDAVEEAFMRIVSNPHTFISVPTDKKAAYISVIVRNIALDMIKMRIKNCEVPIDYEFLQDEHLPDDIVIGNIKAEELINYIISLPPRKKDAVFLKVYFGYSYKQISTILGISEETARKRISEARKLIQKFFNNNKND